MAVVDPGVRGIDGDLADAAPPPEGCGAHRRWLRQSLARCGSVWRPVVSGEVEGGQRPKPIGTGVVNAM